MSVILLLLLAAITVTLLLLLAAIAVILAVTAILLLLLAVIAVILLLLLSLLASDSCSVAHTSPHSRDYLVYWLLSKMINQNLMETRAPLVTFQNIWIE